MSLNKLYFFFAFVCVFSAINATTKVDRLSSPPKQQNVEVSKPSTLELRPENPVKQPRRNLAYAAAYQMNNQILNSGLERLQFLLDYNTKNPELLREMNSHFQKYGNYDWHLVLEDVSAGDIPAQYAYYRFDRNETELFVGAYTRC